MEPYFIVMCFNEDGDPPSLEYLSRTALLKRLEDRYWGDNPRFAKPDEPIDTSSFCGVVIISGNIVAPRPATTVTRYDI
jgi:hypothetical protein